MTTTQFTNSLNSVKAAFKVNRLTQFATVGSLVFGVVATISAAPAQAALLSGQLGFGSGTDDFFGEVKPLTLNDVFSVDFNAPNGTTRVDSATGNFSTYFNPVGVNYGVVADPANFTFLGANGSNYQYTLDQDLKFAFTNGVNLTIKGGSVFETLFLTNKGVGFGIVNSTGSFFQDAQGIVLADSLSFTFNDGSRLGGGQFGITASTTDVPEPFTIIGTLVGGTAAFRMRKKLADANNN